MGRLEYLPRAHETGQAVAEMPRSPQAPAAGWSAAAAIPADLKMLAERFEGDAFDEPARDDLRRRQLPRRTRHVFDMDTLRFNRGWAAYGKALKGHRTDAEGRDYDPKVR